MRTIRYKRVVDAFAEDIRNGRLRPGQRLPTHRSLARMKRLALATASRVYAAAKSPSSTVPSMVWR